ncbi:MAG: hypothetical protein QOF89_1760 [Acidobacteriota bacterium]|jgi:hypothetical protein|nr:hypothetical protein [Acidobacteriota bacterium]
MNTYTRSEGVESIADFVAQASTSYGAESVIGA